PVPPPPPRRSMRLVKIPAIFQVRHDVSNRRRAQGLFKTLRNRARRHRLTRFDISTDEVRQNLAVAPFLKGRIPHSSTLLLVLERATYYCRNGVKKQIGRAHV